jgi:hypothetical protein
MWQRRTASRSWRRHLRFEGLESRRLMAVTTALNSGTLTITGDTAADDIAIVGTANPGEITVTGRNGTLVNGVANGSTTISGVTAHINADFGTGNNVINVDNIYLAGHLQLAMADGVDRVILGATGVVSTGLHCTVATGRGNDIVRAEDYHVYIVGSLTVQPGDDLDSVFLIGASSLTSINIEKGNLSSRGESLECLLRGVTSAGRIGVTSSAGLNNIAIFTSAALAEISVFTNSGVNSLYLDTNYAATYIAVTAAENVPHSFRTVTIARCQAGQVIIRLGGLHQASPGGVDRVMLYGNLIVGPPQTSNDAYPAVATNVLFIETGDAADTVDLSYNVARGNVFASLSELDDTLSLDSNIADGIVSVDGGTGTNRLNLFGNQFFALAASRFS